MTLKNQSPVTDWLLRGVFDAAGQNRRMIEKDGLERAMLLVSDLHGAEMPRAVIGRRRGPGRVGFPVRVRRSNPHRRIRARSTISARTTRGSGGRAPGSTSIRRGPRRPPFGFRHGLEREGLLNGRVAYSLPVGYDGLRVEAAVFRTTYALGGAYHDLNATGVADGVPRRLRLPVRRTRDDSIWISATYSLQEPER